MTDLVRTDAKGDRPAAPILPPGRHSPREPRPIPDLYNSSKPAKGGKPEARDGSKKATVIQLLRRKEGSTAAEIAKLTKWQPHTIRGFISRTVSKKMKFTVGSTRNEQGERVYRVK